MTDGYDISSEIALRWTSLDLSDDQSTLVQIMAWYRQATSHYLNQCWPRSLPPYDVIRPQWVDSPSHLKCWSLSNICVIVRKFFLLNQLATKDDCIVKILKKWDNFIASGVKSVQKWGISLEFVVSVLLDSEMCLSLHLAWKMMGLTQCGAVIHVPRSFSSQILTIDTP